MKVNCPICGKEELHDNNTGLHLYCDNCHKYIPLMENGLDLYHPFYWKGKEYKTINDFL